jgi:hypothetical protein
MSNIINAPLQPLWKQESKLPSRVSITPLFFYVIPFIANIDFHHILTLRIEEAVLVIKVEENSVA